MGIWMQYGDDQLLRAAADAAGELAMASIANTGDSVRYSCRYGWFELAAVSGPVVVSRELYVYGAFRRQGWSDRFEIIKRRLAEMGGATMIIATVRDDNMPEIGALKKHGWTRVQRLDGVSIWAVRLDGDDIDIWGG